MDRQRIKEAIATIADGCGLELGKVEAWVKMLFDPMIDHRAAFSEVLEVFTSDYHGFIAVKLDENGHIVDMHIPGHINSEQIKGLRNPRRR